MIRKNVKYVKCIKEELFVTVGKIYCLSEHDLINEYIIKVINDTGSEKWYYYTNFEPLGILEEKLYNEKLRQIGLKTIKIKEFHYGR